MVLKDAHSLSLEDHLLKKPAINDNNRQLILTRLIYIFFFSIKKADWKLWSSQWPINIDY